MFSKYKMTDLTLQTKACDFDSLLQIIFILKLDQSAVSRVNHITTKPFVPGLLWATQDHSGNFLPKCPHSFL